MFVNVKKSANKSLRKIDKKDQVSITKEIERLESLSTVAEIPHEGKLKGRENRYKIRIGKYRMIYLIQDETSIVITAIAHRKESYKRFFTF